MKTENLAELRNQELLQKIKSLKTNEIVGAAIIGITIGFVIYSVVTNSFEPFTFFL